MCHTALALKKKCNSPGWRHVKSFQIYLQDSLTPVSSHQCEAARRAPRGLRCCNLEGLRWPPILHFWWKVMFPVLVALKNFSQIQTKNHNLTWLQTSIKGVVVSQVVTGFCGNEWRGTTTIFLTYKRSSIWGAEESVPICVLFFPLTVKEG